MDARLVSQPCVYYDPPNFTESTPQRSSHHRRAVGIGLASIAVLFVTFVLHPTESIYVSYRALATSSGILIPAGHVPRNDEPPVVTKGNVVMNVAKGTERKEGRNGQPLFLGASQGQEESGSKMQSTTSDTDTVRFTDLSETSKDSGSPFHGLTLAGLLALVGAAAFWNVQQRPKEYHHLALLSIDSQSSQSMSPSSDYDQLCTKLREINTLAGISGLLGWDEMVMLPSGSSDCRGAQKSVLAGILFDKQTDETLGNLLKNLKEAPEEALNDVQKAVLRDAHKSYVQTTALPRELATRIAELETEGYNAWVDARTKSDFSLFSSILTQWVDINRQKAQLIDPKSSPYDVLLDEYEKGMTSQRLDEIFSEVKEGLVPLIADIRSNGQAPDASFLSGDFDIQVQAKMCEQIALDIGFDLDKGRLDVSVHPFTGGSHPTDVRMTTRFKQDDLTEGLTGAVHETGHALYEQGRNLSPEWNGLPVSEALSMGVHESQSLFWERMVCLSRPFQTYLLSKFQETFPDKFDKVTADMLYGGINRVRDGPIRVEADEVTYTMHVILRYEIERGLIEGTVKVEDVPKLWNEKMKAYLGIEPENDAKGCLQDVHWSGGAMGYFPTYSLGAMFACQIWETAIQEIPDLQAQVTRGEFGTLRQWLKTKIHELGSFHPSGDALMIAVTGKPLDPQIFLRYLKEKYTDIYKL